MVKSKNLQIRISKMKSSDSLFERMHAEKLIDHERYWGPGTVSDCGTYLYATPHQTIKKNKDEAATKFHLDTIKVNTQSQQQILDELKNWCWGKKGIYIYGNLGSGKTTMMEAFADKARSYFPQKVVYEFEYSYLVKGLSNNKEKKMLTSKKMMSSIEVSCDEWFSYHGKNSDILLIDDFLSQECKLHPVDNLLEILNHRIKYNLPTFCTSNMSLNDVITKVSERVGDRLLKLTKSLECKTDESYRLKEQRQSHNNSN